MEDAQVLKNMARELAKAEFNPRGRIQKTFVISRRSLSSLDMISSQHDTPRDALVEYSVRRLLPLIANERKKHEIRKELLAEMSDHFAEGKKLLSKAIEMVGTDDPIAGKLSTTISAYKNALDDITSFIERGKIIEKFQPE